MSYIRSFLQERQKGIFLTFLVAVFACICVGISAMVVELHWMHKQIDNVELQLPATIYADSPVLYPGRAGTSEWLTGYLRRLNYIRSRDAGVKRAEYRSVGDQIILRKRTFLDEEDLPVRVTFRRGRIHSLENMVSGEKISQYKLEPTPLASLFEEDWEQQTPVRLRELPPYLIDAVLAIEDRRFYKHSGVDPVAVLRALWNNMQGDGPLQGGSTITQQLVKNLYLTPERSIRRKAREAALAILMEAKYSKKRILELYLNEVYLGQRGPVSVRGVAEASQLYFKKDVTHLTVPEAALLAGLIRAPHKYSPFTHPDRARGRRDAVLIAMGKTGALQPAELEKYRKAPVAVQKPDTRTNKVPYFVTYVEKQLHDQLSNSSLSEANYRIISTLDSDMQLSAQRAMSEGLAMIDKSRFRKTKKQVQGALIAVEPSTGKIRAFVGGRNFAGNQFDHVSQGRRQPGSSFKPFVFATALETAYEATRYSYTPSTLIEDQPWSLQLRKAVWQPENYDDRYYGIVSLRAALAKSMNAATARLAYDIGFDKVYNLSRAIGLSNTRPYPSIALGSFEVTPLQMIQAYTVFANGGKLVKVQPVEEIIDARGSSVGEHKLEETRVLHEQTAYLITDMLKTAMKNGTGASSVRWGITQPVAGKTGTTNDYKDAWFVGYTPDLICLVWVGYDDNTPVGMTGAEAALPIWARFMKSISPLLPNRDFRPPSGIVRALIDPYTGKLASPYCMHAVNEIFIAGTEPLQYCTEYDHYRSLVYFAGEMGSYQDAQYWEYRDYEQEEAEGLPGWNYGLQQQTPQPDIPGVNVETGEEDSSYTTQNDPRVEIPPNVQIPEGWELPGKHAPVYMAPKPRGKNRVFTNEDIAPAEDGEEPQ